MKSRKVSTRHLCTPISVRSMSHVVRGRGSTVYIIDFIMIFKNSKLNITTKLRTIFFVVRSTSVALHLCANTVIINLAFSKYEQNEYPTLSIIIT